MRQDLTFQFNFAVMRQAILWEGLIGLTAKADQFLSILQRLGVEAYMKTIRNRELTVATLLLNGTRSWKKKYVIKAKLMSLEKCGFNYNIEGKRSVDGKRRCYVMICRWNVVLNQSRNSVLSGAYIWYKKGTGMCASGQSKGNSLRHLIRTEPVWLQIASASNPLVLRNRLSKDMETYGSGCLWLKE